MTKKVGLLTRDAIVAAVDQHTEDVAVPEWGGSVRVKGLTGAERDGYELWILGGKGKDRDVNIRNARSKLVVLSVVDEEGKRVFDDSDAGMLGKKSALALQRVFDVAARLSGLDEKALETLTEELGKGPSADSGSA